MQFLASIDLLEKGPLREQMDSIFRRYTIIAVSVTFLQQPNYADIYYKLDCEINDRNIASQYMTGWEVYKEDLESIVDGIAIISRMSIATKANRSR